MNNDQLSYSCLLFVNNTTRFDAVASLYSTRLRTRRHSIYARTMYIFSFVYFQSLHSRIQWMKGKGSEIDAGIYPSEDNTWIRGWVITVINKLPSLSFRLWTKIVFIDVMLVNKLNQKQRNQYDHWVWNGRTGCSTDPRLKRTNQAEVDSLFLGLPVDDERCPTALEWW